MIVVADAGPIHYLVLIGMVDVLQPLYAGVIVPETVAAELQGIRTGAKIQPDPPSNPALRFLDPGEAAAITLALSLHAGRLLIDDWEGRAEADRQQLRVTGTLGIL